MSSPCIEKELQSALDLLNAIFETMNDAATGAAYNETDAGKLMYPEFRYEPTFEFSEKDLEFMKQMRDKHGYDLNEFINILEEAEEE